MTRFRTFGALLAMAGLWPVVLHAADSGESAGMTHWNASSTTAYTILGDIDVGPDRLVIDDERSYRLTEIRSLDEAEVKTTANLLGLRRLDRVTLYKIDIPASATFRSNNAICRGDITRVIIAEEPKATGSRLRSLGLIFFEGSKEPYFKGWENTASGFCGTFLYVRD